jgi:hypothetical protein
VHPISAHKRKHFLHSITEKLAARKDLTRAAHCWNLILSRFPQRRNFRFQNLSVALIGIYGFAANKCEHGFCVGVKIDAVCSCTYISLCQKFSRTTHWTTQNQKSKLLLSIKYTTQQMNDKGVAMEIFECRKSLRLWGFLMKAPFLWGFHPEWLHNALCSDVGIMYTHKQTAYV